ncbi:MAG: sodium/proton-translocating pyrophosphatase [Eubacteriales bacterium]
MVAEVRDQFNRFPGIMKGEQTPDYAKCVDISTQAAIREMIIPGIIAIVSPHISWVDTWARSLAAYWQEQLWQVFCLPSRWLMRAVWDNAKKLIESGDHGGKGSEAHKAAVIGDTVGDPLKDTAGPSLNILIKLMSIVALLFYPLFI